MYAELRLKVCSKCKNAKEKKEFGADRTSGDGRSCWCKACKKQYRKNDKLKNPKKYIDYEFKRGLRRNYKMTYEHYQKMFTDQKGSCHICERHQRLLTRSLAVDHDHESGAIRGLLCDNCNPGIGYFKHNEELLIKAAEYLRKFKK